MTGARVRVSPGVRLEEGLIRLALAAVVLLCLIRSWTFQSAPLAYLVAVLALTFSSLLIVRPTFFIGRGPVRAVADAVFLGLLLANTGGAGSLFFPLYLPAAISTAGFADRAGGGIRLPVATGGAAAVLVGSYLLAAVYVGGWRTLGSPSFVLNAGILLLSCAAALCLGLTTRAARERAEKAESAATQERDRRERIDGLNSVFGPILGALDEGSALHIVAEAARKITGGSYSHVAALRGGLHRTVMDEAFDACPSWWHPTVQRLLLWSCREGEVVRVGQTIHGMEGFLAVPVGTSDGRWGAIIVGGGNDGAEEERALRGLAAAALPALARRPDTGGGLDLPSGLPNAASLFRVLRARLSAGGTPEVLAIDLGADGTRGAGVREDLLRRLGKRLERAGQRAFRYDDNALIVVTESRGNGAAVDRTGILDRVLEEEAGALAVPRAGLALGKGRGQSPEELVGSAFLALEQARAGEEDLADITASRERFSEEEPVLDAETPSVRGLMKAMAARDPYLPAHSAGVSRIAGRIGRVLSCSEKEIRVLEVGGLLHDLGKIGIPDQVLHKPDVLSDEEYATIKRHPVLGVEILAPFPELAPVLMAVRHHHERFDGSGYPDGLCNEEIPITARVVCVADAFDSMIRERPYGCRIPAEDALEEIRHNAGIQFDPQIADALSQVQLGPGDKHAGLAG